MQWARTLDAVIELRALGVLARHALFKMKEGVLVKMQSYDSFWTAVNIASKHGHLLLISMGFNAAGSFNMLRYLYL